MAARKSKNRKAEKSATKGKQKASSGQVMTAPVGQSSASGKSVQGRGVGKRYSDAERQNILSTAKREGLTAAKVKDRFGVTPVTYYSWRKKSGAKRRRPRGRAAAAGEVVGKTVAGAMNVADAIREEIRAHIRKILPGLLADELGSGSDGGRGRRRSK